MTNIFRSVAVVFVVAGVGTLSLAPIEVSEIKSLGRSQLVGTFKNWQANEQLFSCCKSSCCYSCCCCCLLMLKFLSCSCLDASLGRSGATFNVQMRQQAMHFGSDCDYGYGFGCMTEPNTQDKTVSFRHNNC